MVRVLSTHLVLRLRCTLLSAAAQNRRALRCLPGKDKPNRTNQSWRLAMRSLIWSLVLAGATLGVLGTTAGEAQAQRWRSWGWGYPTYSSYYTYPSYSYYYSPGYYSYYPGTYSYAPYY